MKIRDLSATRLETIVDCFQIAFKDYYVKMPSDMNFWKFRMKAGRIDLNNSFGAFSNGELVAFILHGVGERNDKTTAFNIGTGVIDEFRGNQLVDKLYDHAIPLLTASGVKVCSLEVIEQNDRAIKVYERIGFDKTKSLKCYHGSIHTDKIPYDTKEVTFNECVKLSNGKEKFQAWDNMIEAVSATRDHYKYYKIAKDDTASGYFIINEKTGYTPQLESFDKDWNALLASIRQIRETISINNVDASRSELNRSLIDAALINSINQFEMELTI